MDTDEVVKIEIEIDLSEMLLGDLEVIENYQNKKASVTELLDVMDRIVKGGARRLPLKMLGELNRRISEEVELQANPTTAAGG